MIELLMKPKRAERRPWEMFFIGAFYATLSLFLTKWIFSVDPVLSKYSGILVVTFCVMFTMPFVYYAIKNEEEKDMAQEGFFRLLKEHGKAINYFMFLFMGFVVAFSFWYIVFEDGNQNFKAQIETFCMINRPTNFDQCVSDYIGNNAKTTGFLSSQQKIMSIFVNNISVQVPCIVPFASGVGNGTGVGAATCLCVLGEFPLTATTVWVSPATQT